MLTPDEQLLEFLLDWNDWRLAGAPEWQTFSRATGLCDAFVRWQQAKQLPITAVVLLARFEDDNLDINYPFGGGAEYDYDGCNDTMHLNPKRISWVLKTIAALQRELQPAPAPDVVEALRTCREQFAFYVTSHKTKGTDDGNVKAAINQNFVDMCDKALASTAGDTLKAENERYRTALERAERDLSCRDGNGHYCPNCDRSGFDTLQAIRTALGSDQ